MSLSEYVLTRTLRTAKRCNRHMTIRRRTRHKSKDVRNGCKSSQHSETGQHRNIKNYHQAGLGGCNSPNMWYLSVAKFVHQDTTCSGRWPSNAQQRCTMDTYAFRHVLLVQVHQAIPNLDLANAPVNKWIVLDHISISQPILQLHTMNRPYNE